MIFQINSASKDSDWKNLQLTCGNCLSDWAVDKLKNGLGDYVKTIFLEEKYICKDYRNLFSNFYSKKFNVISPYSKRLHFFSERINNKNDIFLKSQKLQQFYLGYSVIRPVPERSLGRTVIDPLKIGLGDSQNFYCLRTLFKTYIGGAEYEVNGYPYISQDTEVTLCCHSSLWGVCRYLSQKYHEYGEVYPYDLIRMTDIDKGRQAPYRSMTYTDYSSILTRFGCHPLVLRIKKSKESIKKEDIQDIYSYVESGFPVMASIENHVITLIGHTIDIKRTTSADTDNLIDSSQLLAQFIVIDDNFFPYALFGYSGDNRNYGSKYLSTSLNVEKSIESILTIVCPLPEKIFLTSRKARNILIEAFQQYRNHLSNGGKGPYIIRVFLTSGSAYKRKKLQNFMKKPADKDDTIDTGLFFTSMLDLPHFIWLMEVTTPEYYEKKLAIAEIVVDATASKYDNERVIFLRLEDFLWYNGRERVTPNVSKSFEMFRHNLGSENEQA